MGRGALATLIGAIGFAVFVTVWLFNLYKEPLKINQDEVLIIQPGDHLGRLAIELESRGWLPWSARVFRFYGRLTEDDGYIYAGEYGIKPGTTVPDLLFQLRAGDVIQRSITFPEGWTTKQWLAHLRETPLLVETSNEALSFELGAIADLEGRLFPDTYSYTRGESGANILRRARLQMEEVLAETWRTRSDNAAVTSPDDALILASIIEKETGFEGDRGLIASVFSNRLNRGMKLQSDPTVIYGLKEFDGDLKRRHLRITHPYNTYVIEALPVAPICNPGRESLAAALNPEHSPYLYFVARGDGTSQFSETLEQHNQAVVQFQKAGRVENYRSTPSP